MARDPRDLHAHHLYPVRVSAEAGATRDAYREALAEENIGTSVHFLPVHLLTAYRERFPDQPAAAGRRAGRRRAPVAAPLARALGSGHRGRDRGAAPRARLLHRMRRRSVRVSATLVVTGLCTAYILWKIDVGKTIDVLRNAELEYFFAAIAIMIVTVWPMAWRWQKLLDGRGIHDRLRWLLRAYFTAYTAGQVLPTSVGGDAMRIFETSRRHPGHGGPIAGSVLLERALGGAATLDAGGGRLRAGDRPLRRRRLPLGRARLRRRHARARRSCSSRDGRGDRCGRRCRSLRRLRIERPVRAVYEGIHGYRDHAVAARRRHRADARDPGGARAGDLADREGGRRRPLAARRTT